MHIYHKEDVQEPERTEQGEVIYPLFRPEVDVAADKHSLAYVVVPPGKSSPLHYHVDAEESYYILQGRGELRIGDEKTTVGAGKAILIPPRRPHQIVNGGDEDLEFLVVSVPPWREADMVVLEEEEEL